MGHQPGRGRILHLPARPRTLTNEARFGFICIICATGLDAREILTLRTRLNEIMSSHTKQNVEKIRDDTERDRYLSAHDAKEYGIIDDVVLPRTNKK